MTEYKKDRESLYFPGYKVYTWRVERLSKGEQTMTKKEQDAWKDMGMTARGIRSLSKFNKDRKSKGQPEVTTAGVDALIAKESAEIKAGE